MENRNESPWPFPSLQTRPIVETPPGWITLPVLLGHDATRPIGTVRLQASQLPKSPDWCLSLAYTSPPVVRRDRPTVGAYQPEAFGLTLQPAAPAEAVQPWIAEALRLADYWHRCHVEFSTVGDLDAARAALESHLRAAPRAAVDFDTWQQSPYTQVLHKSIAEDYVPRGSAPSVGEPTPIDLCRELRTAAGLFDGAMPCSPKEAWDEAIAKVRALADVPTAQQLALLTRAARAAVAYDAAVQQCANKPERMSSHCTAEGDDLDALYAAWIDASRAALATPQRVALSAVPGEPTPIVDREMVICPGCCHQFRAIPEAVQRLLLDAGIEAPFTAAPQGDAR